MLATWPTVISRPPKSDSGVKYMSVFATPLDAKLPLGYPGAASRGTPETLLELKTGDDGVTITFVVVCE